MIFKYLEIAISMSALLVAICIYYANKKYIAKLARENEQFIRGIHQEKLGSEKIERVITDFTAMFFASKDTGISALIKSGISSLSNEADAQFVVTEIQHRTGKNPLGAYSQNVNEVGILKFFKVVNLESLRVSGEIDNIIKQLKR